MTAKERTGTAIVLGASMAGLLAARVLSETYANVTIVDRDELPTGIAGRKGVPQGDHTHGLLARGRKVLEELFDDFIPEITAMGAVPLDVMRDVVWANDGYPLPRTASGLDGLGVSRVTLEGYIRGKVRQIANVTVLDKHEAVRLLASDDRSRLTGVKVLARGAAEPVDLDADLVVDATGRGNRGPTWLAELGYEKPVEESIDSGTTYMSRDYRRVSGDADFSAILQNPYPANPYGGVAIAVDGDRWMVTLIGCGPDTAPPSDPDGYLEFARRLPNNKLYDLLSKAEPLTAPMKLRLPTSVRRRYERLERMPEGFLAIGDSICAFNPAYGQGMTVAAVEAMALRDSVAKGRDGLQKRYFALAAKAIDVPWDIAVGADLRFEHVEGERTAKVRFINGYVGKLHRAATKHPAVGRAFLRVANLMAAPQSLFAPSVAARVLTNRRPAATVIVEQRELEPVA